MKKYQDKKWLTEQFQKGFSKEQIARNAGNISSDTIEYWRKKFNIPYNKYNSNPNRKYFFNVNYFDTIDTEEKAYWLGFIMADGSIVSTGKKCKKYEKNNPYNRFDLILKQSDIEHVYKLNNALESTYPIIESVIYDKRGFYSEKCELRINSMVFCESLMKNGIFPQKTGKEIIPNTIPEHLLKHFIRGYFDGDGCITKMKNHTYYRFHVCCASESFLKQIANILKNQCDLKVNIKKRNNTNLYYFESNKKNDCYTFFYYLYNDATVYLDRKYLLAKEYLKSAPLKAD